MESKFYHFQELNYFYDYYNVVLNCEMYTILIPNNLNNDEYPLDLIFQVNYSLYWIIAYTHMSHTYESYYMGCICILLTDSLDCNFIFLPT